LEAQNPETAFSAVEVPKQLNVSIQFGPRVKPETKGYPKVFFGKITEKVLGI
jgi:hypothetical protein